MTYFPFWISGSFSEPKDQEHNTDWQQAKPTRFTVWPDSRCSGSWRQSSLCDHTLVQQNRHQYGTNVPRVSTSMQPWTFKKNFKKRYKMDLKWKKLKFSEQLSAYRINNAMLLKGRWKSWQFQYEDKKGLNSFILSSNLLLHIPYWQLFF